MKLLATIRAWFASPKPKTWTRAQLTADTLDPEWVNNREYWLARDALNESRKPRQSEDLGPEAWRI
jgi:hypothetical protein